MRMSLNRLEQIKMSILSNPVLVATIICLFLFFLRTIFVRTPETKRRIVVADLKQISCGHHLPDLFLITQDRESINMKYYSEVFVTLRIGDIVEITEDPWSREYKIINI